VFGGEGFMIRDEIYQFAKIYTREKLRILLTLDMTKTPNKGKRKDQDYAVSWVKAHGKGRVFYGSLGHNPHIFWEPKLLQFYLDGIQFALGDLEADTTPSGPLPEAK
jgi:type 1 glutamine amidotransferase